MRNVTKEQVIITDQTGKKVELTALSNFPVEVINSSLPSGASTDSKQDAILAELQLKADLSETQPVSAASLPLPSGASTEAKQDSIISLFPQDPIDSVPRFISHVHSEIHSGDTFKAIEPSQSIGTSTVQYAIESSTEYPHMVVHCDVYDGSARVDIYKTATFTGGTELTNQNRRQSSTGVSLTTVTSGATSSDGTLIDSFYVGASNRSAGQSRDDAEWILESGETYRVDVVGLVAGTKAIISFNWYR